MTGTMQLTAIIEREKDGFVALCPELDVASQGDSIEEARANLREALELFFETAHPAEVLRPVHGTPRSHGAGSGSSITTNSEGPPVPA